MVRLPRQEDDAKTPSPNNEGRQKGKTAGQHRKTTCMNLQQKAWQQFECHKIVIHLQPQQTDMKTKVLLLAGILTGTSCTTTTQMIGEEAQIRHYVTGDYFRREQGYDYSVIRTESFSADSMLVSVRSRADKKKPSLTFTGAGSYDRKKHRVTVDYQGVPIHFTFLRDTLAVSSPSPATLFYFGSGGATLEGRYILLHEQLDTNHLQDDFGGRAYTCPGSDIVYHVKTHGNRLLIETEGLTRKNDIFAHDIDGWNVDHVSTGDLNNDGQPEIYVFLQSQTPECKTRLIGYAPNRGMSASSIHLPELTEKDLQGRKYDGHDEMEIVENRLCRRWRYTPEGTEDGNATKMIQIQYRLDAGENGWLLSVDKAVTF